VTPDLVTVKDVLHFYIASSKRKILKIYHCRFAAPENSPSDMDLVLSACGQLYQYEPLRDVYEVRLLVLAPGAHSDEIRCELKHCFLSSIPKFDALSYAWGDISMSREVLCNNECIPVTESIFIALHYLRHKDLERTIWVDAICINQGSNVEKSHQVALMRRIYSQAQKTLVWLGEDKSGGAELAFDYVSRLDKCLNEGYQTELELRQRIATEYQIRGRTFENWALDFIDAIAPIFDQTWFRRLWVVQEVALSNHAQLIFGNQTISMDQFMRVMVPMSAFHELNYHQRRFKFHSLGNFVNINTIQRSIVHARNGLLSNQTLNILELLRYTEKFAHTDPRDGIYALLGLTETPGFSIDYSLSTETTFRRFAVWALHAFPDLALLSYTRGVTRSKWDVPSWVPSPDMDGLPFSLLNVGHYQASGKVFSREEKGGSNDIWSLSENGELCLRGKIIDSVLEVGTGALNATPKKGLRYALLESELIARCHTRSLEDERYIRFCAAMTLETTVDNIRASPQQAEWFHHYFLAMQREGNNDNENYCLRNTVGDLQGNWARYRWFCRTKEDRFAFVAWRAEPGDEICIIRGARIPYVIRQQLNGKFMLVGECWIQGLMEGEALNVSGFEWEEICLE
jgi:hypothetical protein